MHIDGVGWYVRLLCAVDHGIGVTGEPVEEQGSVALDQEDGQPLVEVPDLLRLLFTGMSGQCCTQLLDLQYGRLVPAAQGLHNHGDQTVTFAGTKLRNSLTGSRTQTRFVFASEA